MSRFLRRWPSPAMVVAVAAVVIAAAGVASAVTSNTSVNRSPISKLSEGQSRIFWTFAGLTFRHVCEAYGDPGNPEPGYAGGKSRILVEGHSWPRNGEYASDGPGKVLRTSGLSSVAVNGQDFRQFFLTNGAYVLGADCVAQVVMFSG
jgi:hypothetical protein